MGGPNGGVRDEFMFQDWFEIFFEKYKFSYMCLFEFFFGFMFNNIISIDGQTSRPAPSGLHLQKPAFAKFIPQNLHSKWMSNFQVRIQL